MRVVVTRPQADSERTAAALEALGHEVLVTPLMRIEPVAADLAGTWSAIVITSANALQAVPVTADKTLPVFAVGDRSAEAARRAGFSEVSSANGDITDLVRLVAARAVGAKAPLLYLAGEDRAGDLVAQLAAHESYESFFTLAQQIDFIEEARQRSIAVAILFMVTPDQTSVTAYRNLRDRFPRAMLVPLHNEMLGSAQYRDKYPISGSGALTVKLPALAPGLRKLIDSPPFSFANSNMGSATDVPLDAHIELQRWLRRIYLEFRELDLRLLLADLSSSIRFGS